VQQSKVWNRVALHHLQTVAADSLSDQTLKGVAMWVMEFLRN
jgi:hypothetical protein